MAQKQKKNQTTQTTRKQKSQVRKVSNEVIELLKGRLLYDNVLVQPIVFEKSAFGLVNPQQYEDKPEFGKVLLVGNGRLLDTGTVVKPLVKEGDTVLFQKYSAQKVRVNSVDYLIIREEDIYLIL
ncbi:MAG TPA: co-chaperone GroES [Candidatus Pelethenecus sp.]|nr:co-chaperone GroES [Candidatus Pelethenecus sp.]